MAQSILTSTKKLLGIDEAYTEFDTDVIIHINTALDTLTQLGIGPPGGFMVTGPEETWEEFIGSTLVMNSVKSYVFLRVRILFDPPTTSFHINSVDEQIKMLEWRLSLQRELTDWVDPTPIPPLDDEPFQDEIVLDGGVG